MIAFPAPARLQASADQAGARRIAISSIPLNSATPHTEPIMKTAIVATDPEILGGTPVFAGTRIPIAVLFENLADGLSLDEILESYPTLEREQAIEALRQAETLLEMRRVA
jgi:uncharacterized protein (DUF433 family)